MPELVERIKQLIAVVETEATAAPVVREYQANISDQRTSQTDWSLERRLARLDDDERSELDRLLRKLLDQS